MRVVPVSLPRPTRHHLASLADCPYTPAHVTAIIPGPNTRSIDEEWQPVEQLTGEKEKKTLRLVFLPLYGKTLLSSIYSLKPNRNNILCETSVNIF